MDSISRARKNFMTYKCQNCGAPIEGIVCPYCNTRNAVDLKLAYPVYEKTERVCPNCDVFLETHLIDENKRLYIETCKHCKGIFLDFGELEEILEKEIKKSERYDFKRLHEIQNNPLVREKEVRYKKCPECRKVMLRINYKGKSGVIIDRCKEHGYWLDGGELRQIMEWAKLEGIRDFTPMAERTDITFKSTATGSVNTRYGRETISEFDPILGFFRKIYGF